MDKGLDRRTFLKAAVGGAAAGALSMVPGEGAAKGNSAEQVPKTPEQEREVERETREISRLISEDLKAARDGGNKELEKQILRELEIRLKRLLKY